MPWTVYSDTTICTEKIGSETRWAPVSERRTTHYQGSFTCALEYNENRICHTSAINTLLNIHTEGGRIIAMGPYILMRYIMSHATIHAVNGTLSDILSSYISDPNIVCICLRSHKWITESEGSRSYTAKCGSNGHIKTNTKKYMMDCRHPKRCVACYERELDAYKSTWPTFKYLKKCITDNDIVENMRRDFLVNGKRWIHFMWWCLTSRSIPYKKCEFLEYVNPPNIYHSLFYVNYTVLRGISFKRLANQKELSITYANKDDKKRASYIRLVRELEQNGYTYKDTHATNFSGNGSYMFTTKNMYVTREYYDFLLALLKSSSTFIMSPPDPCEDYIKDNSMAGPAEYMTLGELTHALDANQKIYGNMTRCINGHHILDTDEIERGQFFSEAWTLARLMGNSSIVLKPPGRDITDEIELNEPWRKRNLNMSVYDKLNLVFEFEYCTTSKRARLD